MIKGDYLDIATREDAERFGSILPEIVKMIDQELLTYLVAMEKRIIGAIICEREAEPKPPESFDLVEAAKFLGRSPRWLRDNCTSLGIGHERLGRGFRFTLRELERYLARHRRKGKKGIYEA